MNTSAHHNSMIQTLHFGLNKIPKNLEHSQLSAGNQPVSVYPPDQDTSCSFEDYFQTELGFFLTSKYLAQQGQKKIMLISHWHLVVAEQWVSTQGGGIAAAPCGGASQGQAALCWVHMTHRLGKPALLFHKPQLFQSWSDFLVLNSFLFKYSWVCNFYC